MKAHVVRMVEEHSQLIVKINKLEDFLYGNDGINIHTDINNNKTQTDLLRNMVEFANKATQLRSMKTYLLALECRLNNEGVFYEDGQYLERVATLQVTKPKEEGEDLYMPNNDE